MLAYMASKVSTEEGAAGLQSLRFSLFPALWQLEPTVLNWLARLAAPSLKELALLFMFSASIKTKEALTNMTVSILSASPPLTKLEMNGTALPAEAGLLIAQTLATSTITTVTECIL